MSGHAIPGLLSCSALSAGSVGALVARGTRVRLTVRGNSMSPMIRSGDRVVLGPRRDRESRGDLIVVSSGGGLALRRFVDRPSEGVMFTTSGEGSGRGVPLSETALLAAVQAVERNGRVVPSEPQGGTVARLVSAIRRLVRRLGG